MIAEMGVLVLSFCKSRFIRRSLLAYVLRVKRTNNDVDNEKSDLKFMLHPDLAWIPSEK